MLQGRIEVVGLENTGTGANVPQASAMVLVLLRQVYVLLWVTQVGSSSSVTKASP